MCVCLRVFSVLRQGSTCKVRLKPEGGWQGEKHRAALLASHATKHLGIGSDPWPTLPATVCPFVAILTVSWGRKAVHILDKHRLASNTNALTLKVSVFDAFMVTKSCKRNSFLTFDCLQFLCSPLGGCGNNFGNYWASSSLFFGAKNALNLANNSAELQLRILWSHNHWQVHRTHWPESQELASFNLYSACLWRFTDRLAHICGVLQRLQEFVSFLFCFWSQKLGRKRKIKISMLISFASGPAKDIWIFLGEEQSAQRELCGSRWLKACWLSH